jgi:mono/diheme cytochrome c family protein
MKYMRWGVVLAAGVLAIPALLLAQQIDAGKGREQFEAYQCWQCHGFEGQGGAALRIAPMVYPFEAFTQLVRHTNEMPAYSPNALNEETLRLIWDYLRTRPEPPAVEDIPALRDR